MATISLCPPSTSRLVIDSLLPAVARSASSIGTTLPSRSAPLALGSSSSPSASLAQDAPVSTLWDRATSALAELFPAILLAVPKSKISHSRKSMRSANKGLRNKSNFSNCPACGGPKLAHHTCPTCYSQINRRWKSEARATAEGPKQEPEVVIRHET